MVKEAMHGAELAITGQDCGLKFTLYRWQKFYLLPYFYSIYSEVFNSLLILVYLSDSNPG